MYTLVLQGSTRENSWDYATYGEIHFISYHIINLRICNRMRQSPVTRCTHGVIQSSLLSPSSCQCWKPQTGARQLPATGYRTFCYTARWTHNLCMRLHLIQILITRLIHNAVISKPHFECPQAERPPPASHFHAWGPRQFTNLKIEEINRKQHESTK